MTHPFANQGVIYPAEALRQVEPLRRSYRLR